MTGCICHSPSCTLTASTSTRPHTAAPALVSGSSRRAHRQQLLRNKAFLALAPCRTADDRSAGPATGATMTGYVVGFIALFLLSGIGNGSVSPVADLARA